MKKDIPASHLLTPKTFSYSTTEHDTRVELPFQLFENLTYIGIVSQQSWYVHQHFHDHFELCYVDEGHGWFSIEGNLYQVTAGDLFLTKSQEIHQGAAEGDQPYRLYYLGFQLEHMRQLEIDYSRLGLNRVVKDRDGIVKKMCDHIFHEIQVGLAHSNWMVHGFFLQMLVHVIRSYNTTNSEHDKVPFARNAVILELLTFLHTNVTFHHSIEELSHRFHLSRTHLEREFKQNMGVALGHYIRTLCLDRAKYYLRETSFSITMISEKLEFASIHKFSMFFKRMTELSPLQYRKKIREDSSGSSS